MQVPHMYVANTWGTTRRAFELAGPSAIRTDVATRASIYCSSKSNSRWKSSLGIRANKSPLLGGSSRIYACNRGGCITPLHATGRSRSNSSNTTRSRSSPLSLLTCPHISRSPTRQASVRKEGSEAAQRRGSSSRMQEASYESRSTTGSRTVQQKGSSAAVHKAVIMDQQRGGGDSQGRSSVHALQGQDAVESAASDASATSSLELLTGWDALPARYKLVLACAASFIICNMDKINMSVAIIPMAEDFGWSRSVSGLVQSSFFYGYMLTQLPGGVLASKFGGRTVLPTGVALFSLATAGIPLLASTIPGLCLSRALVGLGEAVAPSAATDMVARVVPPNERARAVTFIFSGLHVGAIVGLVLSPLLIEKWGWPSLFITFGALGLVWVAWFEGVIMAGLRRSDPDVVALLEGMADHGRSGGGAKSEPATTAAAAAATSDEELHLTKTASSATKMLELGRSSTNNGSSVENIAGSSPGNGKGTSKGTSNDNRTSSGSGDKEPHRSEGSRLEGSVGSGHEESSSSSGSGVPWRAFVRCRPVQALMWTHFVNNWFHYTMLAWLPTYFVQTLSVDLTHAAQTALLPPIAGIAASAVAGPAADSLVAGGMPTAKVRKIAQSVAFLVPAAILFGACTDFVMDNSNLSVISITLSLGISSFSLAGLYCTHQELSPKYAPALLGLTNTAGAVPGIAGVATVGFLYDLTHSWELCLFVPSALLMLSGAFVYNVFCTIEYVDFDSTEVNKPFRWELPIQKLWSGLR